MNLTSSYQYIGRTTGVSCDNGWNFYVLLYAKTSGSVSTGKHTVTVKMRLACDVNSTFYGYPTDGAASVDGVRAIYWDGVQNPNGAWNTTSLTEGGVTYRRWIDIAEGSAVIDTKYAAKEVTIAASWSRNSLNEDIPGWLPYTTEIKASIKVTLPMIASTSVPTVSASSVAMLNKVTIYTNRVNSSLTHDLTYSFGGSTGTIATGVGASYEWTVPDLVSKIPGKSSGVCTITCKTKSGSTVIGTKTVDITLNIPAASQPSAHHSPVQMGTSVDIYTNRISSAYTHKLTYTIGGKSDTIGDSVGASKPWTPPKSLAAYTGNKTSATCTITCATYNGTLHVGTKTTDIVLTVPNATVPTVSASTVAMGSQITISMPKEAEVYTHDLSYAFSGTTGTIGNGLSGDYPWTVPLDLAKAIKSGTKGTVTVICKTMLGGTLVGTEYAYFEATVPNNTTTQPKVSWNVEAVDTPFSGVFVAGRSKVKVSYDASSDYSTIASYATSLPGYSGDTNPYTSGVLRNPGTFEVLGRVTDARGYYTDKTESIAVIDYSVPRVVPHSNENKIICTRCNSDGTVDPGGVRLRIKAGRDYRKVISNGVQKNFCKLSYQWKTDGASQYSNPIELISRTESSDFIDTVITDVTFNNTTAYNIQIIVEDDVGESDTVTITVPTVFATWHVPAGGHGMTIGGYHDPSKRDVFDCKFAAEFWNGVKIPGALLPVEDPNYPGCYYHMVNGEQEWVNPPMNNYWVRYPTTKRWQGKTVHVVTFPWELPNNGNTFIDLAGIHATNIVSYSCTNGMQAIPAKWQTYETGTLETREINLIVATWGININTNYDASGSNSAIFTIEYTID